MLIKKWAGSFLLSFITLTSAFAGTEDWNGNFTIRDSKGDLQTVIHAPNYVKFMFLNAGSCLRFGKGSKLNGIEFTDNVELCTNANVQFFIKEIQKIGTIVSQTVTLGSTYPAQ